MGDKGKEFVDAAVKLSHNPIGIIGLFLVMVEAIAALVIVNSKLESAQNTILVYFVIIFPFTVLSAFYRLVTKHHEKLYSPSDYKDENNFVNTIKKYDYSRAEDVEVFQNTEQKTIKKCIEEKGIQSNEEFLNSTSDNQLNMNEIQAITAAINNVSEMQKVMLGKIEKNDTSPKDDNNYKKIEELKANIEKNISIDIPNIINQRKNMQYNMLVKKLKRTSSLVGKLIDNGFNAKVYEERYITKDNKEDREEDYEGIWLGKNIPANIAVEVIKIAIDYFPHLKYIHISGDNGQAPPEMVHNQIFIGGATSAARMIELKAWCKDDLNKLKNDMTIDELHNIIRSFYNK